MVVVLHTQKMFPSKRLQTEITKNDGDRNAHALFPSTSHKSTQTRLIASVCVAAHKKTHVVLHSTAACTHIPTHCYSFTWSREGTGSPGKCLA
ncbi:MAG: hypothetical protein COA67_08910 [Lutibacter sp.]|nr:MAG: hypothetical protein COA67_08910 [Lutibacter sp.]